MKGQLSAEMLVVLVVILGLAVLLASVMMKSASNAGRETELRANETLAKTQSCTDDAQCLKYGAYRCETSLGYCAPA